MSACLIRKPQTENKRPTQKTPLIITRPPKPNPDMYISGQSQLHEPSEASKLYQKSTANMGYLDLAAYGAEITGSGHQRRTQGKRTI